MPPLRNIFRRLSEFTSPWKPKHDSASPEKLPSNGPGLHEGQHEQDVTSVIEQRMTDLTVDKKRKFQGSEGRISAKRHKQNGEAHPSETYVEAEAEYDDREPQDCSPGRAARPMPPPATPGQRQRMNWAIRQSLDNSDRHLQHPTDTESTFSVKTGFTTQPSPEQYDQYTMEQARRHAAAVQLPANSGVWEKSEQELFYHLALRGFEPLLPPTWMLDFKTLPLSLYTRPNSDSAPIITNLHGTEFRAIRALRDLIETGKNIRDKTLASPGVHIESTLHKAFNNYLSWATTDAGIRDSPHLLPVHSTIIRRKGQSTAETIAELATNLHTLAARHREKRGIHPSIESHHTSYLASPDADRRQTQVLDEPEDGLPILTGIAIVSSVLAVFTFNAHTPPPSSMVPPSPAGGQPTGKRDAGSTGHTEDSGLRFIATFDFSEAAHDVWNALAIALVAVHLRKIMLECLAQQEGSNTQMALDDDIDGDGGADSDDDPDL